MQNIIVPVLKGDISITDNIGLVSDVVFSNAPNIKVIDLEGNCTAIPSDHPNVIIGECLMPPIDALIAKEDGDESLFDTIYAEYFNESFVFQFMSALIVYLYNGGNLLLYHPEIDNITIHKLIEHIYVKFGIKIGVMGTPDVCMYNVKYNPYILGLIYTQNVITPYQFLYEFPVDALIPEEIMAKLYMDLMPYGDYNSTKRHIVELVGKLKEKPRLRNPIFHV